VLSRCQLSVQREQLLRWMEIFQAATPEESALFGRFTHPVLPEDG